MCVWCVYIHVDSVYCTVMYMLSFSCTAEMDAEYCYYKPMHKAFFRAHLPAYWVLSPTCKVPATGGATGAGRVME